MSNLKENKVTTKSIIIDFIQHNPRHYIKIKFKGTIIRPCARCFGLWLGLIVGLILSISFILKVIIISNFLLVFSISWVFVIPAIIDWSTVKLKLRRGNNKIRLTTGFLQGIGIITYFLILPASILFKIVTYGLYEGIFYLIRWKYHIKHYQINQ